MGWLVMAPRGDRAVVAAGNRQAVLAGPGRAVRATVGGRAELGVPGHEAVLAAGKGEAGPLGRERAGTGPAHLADHLAGVGYLSGQVPAPHECGRVSCVTALCLSMHQPTPLCKMPNRIMRLPLYRAKPARTMVQTRRH